MKLPKLTHIFRLLMLVLGLVSFGMTIDIIYNLSGGTRGMPVNSGLTMGLISACSFLSVGLTLLVKNQD